MGYSRAVVKGGWCFVSGVTGYDYATMTMPEGIAAQARNCLATIDRDLVPVLGAALGGIRPAATMIIAGLIRPEMLVEIEVTAFKG